MARTNDEIDASLIRMQDSITRHVQELDTRIDALAETLTTRIVDVDAKLRHHFDVLEVKQSDAVEALADKTDAEIAALSGRVDTYCAGC